MPRVNRHPSHLDKQDQELHNIQLLFPHMVEMVNDFRAGKGRDLPDWPDWCLLPMSGWAAINTPPRTPLASLTALGTWSFSRGTYAIDPTLTDALAETGLSDALPSRAFYHLPEWCVFIETPGRMFSDTALTGFWAHLEWDTNQNRPELRLLLLTDTGLVPIVLHLGDWSVLTAIKKAIEEAKSYVQPGDKRLENFDLVALKDEITPLVSLLLYLCSDAPDIEPGRQPKQSIFRPQYGRGAEKAGKLVQAEKPMRFEVGRVIGGILRSAQSAQEPASTGKGKRAHLRRGHWHGFWYGPRDGERRFGYRWLHPIIAGGKQKTG